MSEAIPARLSSDGLTATWNPALTRETHVQVEVRLPSGEVTLRTTMNSGRVKVRPPERIERILASTA